MAVANTSDARKVFKARRTGGAGAVAPRRRTVGRILDPNDARLRRIVLPRPADGKMYTPAEAVACVRAYADAARWAKGGAGPMARSSIALFKDKMVAEGLVPVGRSALNKMLARYGGAGAGRAPE